MGGSFLQSWEWGTLQESLNGNVLRVSADGYLASILIKKLPLGMSYLYAPYGPIVANIDSLKQFITAIKNDNSGVIFLRIEPQYYHAQPVKTEDLLALGLKPSISRSPQPHMTLQLDLTPHEDQLLLEMESETRYAIKTAKQRGVLIVTSEENSTKDAFQDFWNLFLLTNTRHNLRRHPKKYYENLVNFNGDIKIKIYLAKLDTKVIAGAIILLFDKTAVYLYAASVSGFGKYNAPSLLLWQAIKEAKYKNCICFDFWGISDNKDWEGVTKFKKSFGGRETTYAGTWDLPIHKNLFTLYSIMKKFL